MPARMLASLLGLAVLAGCAGDAARSELTEAHPAHPNAPESPLPSPSGTLAVGSVVPTPGRSEATDANAAHVHHGRTDHEQQQPAAAPDHARHNVAQPTTTTAPATQRVENAALYTCPHHPEVTSDRHGETCPKCRMKLVPQKAAPRPGTGHEGH